MPKPTAINASTLLATKGTSPSAAGTVQRGDTAPHKLVDLNFKVEAAFKEEFAQLAFGAPGGRLKHVQLLKRALAAYKREQGLS